MQIECMAPSQLSARAPSMKVCHNCETGLVAGAADYRPDSIEPPGDGNVLICCSRPKGDIVIDL